MSDEIHEFRMDIKELDIPVFWGHISARAWGDEKHYPVLVVHGIQDHAEVFNYLLPLLPKHYYYVCIDLPGHGKSGHFPGHNMIHFFDFVFVYKIVLDYLKWKECYLLGHSLGGQVGMRFAQLYPNYFQKIILLDTLYTFHVLVPMYQDYYTYRFDSVLRYFVSSSKNQQPSYTYEEAVEKIMKNRDFTRERAETYLKRILVPLGDDKYRFSVDPRLKYFLAPPSGLEYTLDLFRTYPVNCPVLIILGKKNNIQLMYFRDVIRYYRTRKNVTIRYVDYGHDVHFTNPEVVAPFICDFLSKKIRNKL